MIWKDCRPAVLESLAPISRPLHLPCFLPPLDNALDLPSSRYLPNGVSRPYLQGGLVSPDSSSWAADADTMALCAAQGRNSF